MARINRAASLANPRIRESSGVSLQFSPHYVYDAL
jgi:hypothetical protein